MCVPVKAGEIFMASNLHISISAEPIAYIGSFAVTNSILTSLIVSALLIIFAVAVKLTLKTTGKPSRFQSFVEFLVETFRNLTQGIVESEKKVALFTPIVFSFFLFILANNWLGLLPGVGTIGLTEEPTHVEVVQQVNASETPVVESTTAESVETTEEEAEVEEEHGPTFIPLFRAGTADLNTTIALALISVILTQVFGFQFQKIGYLGKYINFTSPINFFVGLLETILELAKIASFAFRLFGNVFAGEVLLAVMMFLIPVIIPMPFYGLEIFVGFIQALVFSILSLVFFNMATIGHGDEH
jgi:F-type H+-transporting ATPase subunit a